MKTRVLGKDLTVSAVSLGCMGFTHAYGTAMDEKEAARVIAQAVELTGRNTRSTWRKARFLRRSWASARWN